MQVAYRSRAAEAESDSGQRSEAGATKRRRRCQIRYRDVEEKKATLEKDKRVPRWRRGEVEAYGWIAQRFLGGECHKELRAIRPYRGDRDRPGQLNQDEKDTLMGGKAASTNSKHGVRYICFTVKRDL